jgi:hypothetical protein
MKNFPVLLVFLVVVFTSSISSAIDPGSATGTLTVDGDRITLNHAYAHLHDNAEGWLDTGKEMRILVSDREIPREAISGLSPFFGLSEMVSEGAVRGVLLRFDPAKPKSVLVTVLYQSKEEGYSLANRTISDSEKSPLEDLLISELRVSASVNHSSPGNSDLGWPSESYSFKFSAPLFREPPVTAILRGKAALKSPQIKVVLAKAEAMKKGDLETARKYTSERSNRETDRIFAQSAGEAINMMREAGEDLEQSVVKGKLKLIVRGERASLVVDTGDGKTLYGLVRKDGRWLVD